MNMLNVMCFADTISHKHYFYYKFFTIHLNITVCEDSYIKTRDCSL